MKWLQKEGISDKKIPLLLLLAVGIIEFLFITLESLFSYIGYYLAEDYLIVPCLLLLGYALQKKPTAFARRRLTLSVAAVSWFVIVQCIHRLQGMDNHPMATVFFVYLMAFPFASLADDRENAGLRLIGGTFVAASLVLVGYSLLLFLNQVPSGMEEVLFWDGARLHALWHPNINACFFMIGIGFSAAFCAMTEKPWAKALLLAAIVLQFLAMALTNCRTVLLMTGALLSGFAFFWIFRGSWKQLVLGLLAAAVLLVGSFKLSGMLYQWNNDRQLASLRAAQEAAPPETLPAETITVAETLPMETAPVAETIAEETAVQETVPAETIVPETAPKEIVLIEDTGIILGDNEQGTLSNDMRTLNGRTQIWEAALKAIRDDKTLALWGTEYSGTVISVYHWFDVIHAHNSWMETLMRMGLPGLLFSLIFTGISVWSAIRLIFRKDTELWKKAIVMTTMCLLAAGFLEPYLFITNVYYHLIDFIFFFCTGYLDYWCRPKQNP